VRHGVKDKLQTEFLVSVDCMLRKAGAHRRKQADSHNQLIREDWTAIRAELI